MAAFAGLYLANTRVGDWIVGFYRAAPVLVCPAEVDFGVQEAGTVAIRSLLIQNPGRGVLVLDNFYTTCTCGELDARKDDAYQALTSLTIPPKEEATVFFRLAVKNESGNGEEVAIRFRSNDPTQPSGSIRGIVRWIKGGVITVPRRIVFGKVPLGKKATQTFAVYDGRMDGRRIEKIVTSNADRLSVRQIAAPTGGEPPPSGEPGHLLGFFEVTAATQQVGPLSGDILIFLKNENRPPDVLPIDGKVADTFEVLPTRLVLSQVDEQSGIYRGKCLVVTSDGKPLKLQLEKGKCDGLKVRFVQSKENPALVLAEFELDAGREASSPRKLAITLLVEIDKKVRKTLVPIVLLEAEGKAP